VGLLLMQMLNNNHTALNTQQWKQWSVMDSSKTITLHCKTRHKATSPQ